MKEFIQKHLLKLKPYQPGKPISEVQRELGLTEVLKLASNENLAGPSPKAVKALKAFAAEMNYYPDGGCYLLRKGIAGKFDVPFDNVAVGNGTDEIIRLLCNIFLSPGMNTVAGNPSFVMYRISTMAAGAEPVEVSLDGFTHDLPAMLDRVDENTRIFFICNPNNPTGTIVTKSQVDEVIDRIPDHVCVVFDEAYFEFADDSDYPDGLDYFAPDGRVAVLRTFSKIYGLAGLRIGYGFLPDAVADAFHRVRNPFNVNQAAQEAALAALGDDRHVKRTRKFMREGRNFLYGSFEKMGLDCVPTQANFILVHVKGDAEDVFQRLLRKGVIVRPGKFLGYPEHIRVTIPSVEECKVFARALEEVLSERG
ncbi:MAG: histidinol-phosphate transaminase [bacterium]